MMRELLCDYGMFVVGPCCSLNEALAEAAGEFDGAFLDLNLSGEFVYPVAAKLAERNIPFAFVTGYDGATVDRRFEGVPILQKPITRESLEVHLNSMLGVSVPAAAQVEASTHDPPQSARSA
jgi:CheY-like chemotaxis protein